MKDSGNMLDKRKQLAKNRAMRTKIIATVGPASSGRETLSRLIQAGVRIFRLNFSHGDASQFADLVALLRQLEAEYQTPITLLQDLSGPKIRIGELPAGSLSLEREDQILLGVAEGENPQKLPFVPFNHEAILAGMEVGDKVVLSDGGLQFHIKSQLGEGLFCLVACSSGIITSRKGLALPGKSIQLSALTDKDKEDLQEGLRLGVDAVALSFVQTPQDVAEAKALIKASGCNIPVIAKLERRNAVDRLEEILEEADIIMVARGDLGVECPLPELPAMQKRIIRVCNRKAKPVIVATQMLLSMVNSPSPTRAETTDVANAVLDGADCVMLSEETAMGNFPVETVQFMRQIVHAAEELHLEQASVLPPLDEQKTPDFLAYSACLLANKTNANAIVAHSMSGSAARVLSARRPRQIIHALTPNDEALRFLNFSWGVSPHKVDESIPGHLERAEHFINSTPLFEAGTEAVITAGQPKPDEKPRGTNLVKIYRK